MSAQKEISWFLDQFGSRIEEKVVSTPFTLPMFAGIAFQETGYLWRRIRENTRSEEEFLEACVGDIIGGPRRKAFPRTPQDLKALDQGQDMYGIARDALKTLGSIAPEYAPYVRYKKRFCRGYGLFQYDLQFFKEDPNYFLSKSWKEFDGTFGKALSEAETKAKKLSLYVDRKLTVDEAVKVAIAYNRGSYDPNLGDKQGHKNDAGEYYGELVRKFITLATRLSARDRPTTPGLNGGPNNSLGQYLVNARSGLILRSAPSTQSTRLSAVPVGRAVNVLGFAGGAQDWALVDLEGDGMADGFMASAFLLKA